MTDASDASLATNPILQLDYEPAFESLGGDYYDIVPAAEFPQHILRFRNDEVLSQLGLDPATVSDEDWITAFGKFQGRYPFLAMRYHGYQFGEYNRFLGDGRGFLYGQVRGVDGALYDFGTKGSGTTPYSRGGDGRLTLKGGVREVLAAEMLHHLGVRTSRCLSLVETGESLWRGDEPSPTRSSVMVRFSRSHIRFGTFERLHHIQRPDLIQPLLDHVIQCYYPHLWHQDDRYARFYAELVQRVAELVAQWMSVGFCHAVLNTDNMSITGESFDYGPYGFIDRYNPAFTAAYFDYMGRYCYANQPSICHENLFLLQVPLKAVILQEDMEAGLEAFEDHYLATYYQRMMQKLGVENAPTNLVDEVLNHTLQWLQTSQMGYHDFFLALRQHFSPRWRQGVDFIFAESIREEERFQSSQFNPWRQSYHRLLNHVPDDDMPQVAQRLARHNPNLVIVRPEIEAIWEPIATENDWMPFNDLLKRIRNAVVLG